MKLILIFVFVCSLDVLTLLAEKTAAVNETEAATSERNGRSSDSFGIQYNFSSRQKRGLPVKSCSTGRWCKVNSSPVCFGARNHQFGRFHMPSSGRLAAVKLVHLYGYVSCKTSVGVDNWTYWGCGYSQVQHKVNVVITTSSNRILFPPNQLLSSTHGGEGKWHHIIGYNSWSPELVLSVFSHPHWISYLQQLRVWYGEDLMDWGEGDNGGRVCCDVFALYV